MNYPELYEKAVRRATQGCTPINAINNQGVVDIAHSVYADALTEANKLLEQTIEVLERFKEQYPSRAYRFDVQQWWTEQAKPLLDNLKALKSNA